MWKKYSEENPISYGVYFVYGLLNKNTEFEMTTRYVAYWQPEFNCFTDRDGEDFIGLNDGITHWFDFSLISDPE